MTDSIKFASQSVTSAAVGGGERNTAEGGVFCER